MTTLENTRMILTYFPSGGLAVSLADMTAPLVRIRGLFERDYEMRKIQERFKRSSKLRLAFCIGASILAWTITVGLLYLSHYFGGCC